LQSKQPLFTQSLFPYFQLKKTRKKYNAIFVRLSQLAVKANALPIWFILGQALYQLLFKGSWF